MFKMGISDVSPVFCNLALNPCSPINRGEGKGGHRVGGKETMEFHPSLLGVALIWDGCMLLLQTMSGYWNVIIGMAR